MRQFAKTMADVALLLIMLDLVVLFFSMGQVMAGQRTGHWSPFWESQARFVVEVLKRD